MKESRENQKEARAQRRENRTTEGEHTKKGGRRTGGRAAAGGRGMGGKQKNRTRDQSATFDVEDVEVSGAKTNITIKVRKKTIAKVRNKKKRPARRGGRGGFGGEHKQNSNHEKTQN